MASPNKERYLHSLRGEFQHGVKTFVIWSLKHKRS
ncbi:hypothetical protein E2C01_095318 [Portunus trituberculatus]|uniref:Uncharacterized protein n=1 Tax=Portunus trituberculatus TaxID=210409 RepID=A0A5B7JZU9_PORTR|nr:hypothetical protein [Portunus trituberculatus]